MPRTPLTRIRPRTRILAALVLAAGCTAGVAATSGFDPDRAVVKPAGTLEFQNINPAIAMAHAYGDRSKGAHGSFGTFPAEFITPMHTHTGAYHGVVIEGSMTNPFAGEAEPPTMGPGSYWYVPAGAEHATACVSATPCKFYFYADGAFDFTPTR
jgi:hypothetical protein